MSSTPSRRTLLSLSVGAAISFQFAESAGSAIKPFRLAVVIPFPRTGPGALAMEDRLRELGYQNGQNLQIDYVQFSDEVGGLTTTIAEAVGRGADAISSKTSWTSTEAWSQ
jgi:hypothetical protein